MGPYGRDVAPRALVGRGPVGDAQAGPDRPGPYADRPSPTRTEGGGPGMRPRGALVSLILGVVPAVGGAVLLDRAGALTPGAEAVGTAPSGAWFCPHGGGRSGWHVSLSLTNPGSTDVRARVTTFGPGRPTAPAVIDVPARSTSWFAVPASGPDRA